MSPNLLGGRHIDICADPVGFSLGVGIMILSYLHNIL